MIEKTKKYLQNSFTSTFTFTFTAAIIIFELEKQQQFFKGL